MADSQKFVEDLFEAALARPREERSAYLDSACPDSPQVRELVRMLLLADERAGDFLEFPFLSPSDTSSQEPPLTFEAGSTVAGRFQIHRFIAGGGMGEVYEAWDTELRERVAIKTIRPELAQSPSVIDRFRREVKQARAISHPNVCRIHELYCDTSNSETKVWFLSMEFLDGFTLSEQIQHVGPVDPAQAFDLLQQLVSGLNALHANGVIHRDLKCGNIMLVSGAPGQLRAVITDFGLATNVLHREGGLHEAGGQGTPEFMAPEQVHTADVTALADQYALGVILCEMLTAARPKHKDVTSGRAQLEARLAKALGKSVGPRWSRVILRCLEQKPADRFPSLDEVVLALKPHQPRTRLWLAVAAAIALLIAGALWYRARSAPPATSLAVLPLVNRSGDPNLDYVGAGITEALTDDLSSMPGLQVAAGSVARHYQTGDTDPATAGSDMHVGSIVTGSFQSSNGKLLIPIELIQVRSGKQLWGQTYQGTTANLADMQHEIATDVAYHLKIQLDAETTARLKRQYSTNPAAYDAYFKGRVLLGSRTHDSLREAVAEFQRAVTADPNYAPALAGLADCYSLLAFYDVEPSVALLRNAFKTSQDALQIDSTSAEAYTSRAFARTRLNFDWDGAEADYKRAIQLDPNYVQAHTWYALDLLTPQGRDAEARAQLKYVQSADPQSPVATVGLAMMERFAGRTTESIRLLQPHVNEAHLFDPAIGILAENYVQQGKARQAIELLRPMPAAPEDADSKDGLLAIAYASTGETAKATEIVQRLTEKVHAGEPCAYVTAQVFTALRNHQRAIEMLQIALNRREPALLFLKVDPLVAPLRSEQQFQTLLQQMNLQ
ncbi:MAG TPA: protein kinase [Acidobacteriaceae bacterium]|nr:protein kinase [Acidobacteriaceae bacterium]